MFVHSSVWLGLQTVPSFHWSHVFRVSFIERFHCTPSINFIVTHCLPTLLLGVWVHQVESTNDLNQSMENNWAHWAADMSVAQKSIISLHISLWCGRGSCYGVTSNGDVVTQSRSKEEHCSESSWPWGFFSFTRLWLDLNIGYRQVVMYL